jgi:Tol biopolymer transport system component
MKQHLAWVMGAACLACAVAGSAGTIAPVSRSAADSVFSSANGASDASRQHAVSADGNRVVFVSSATNIIPGQSDLNGQADAFLLDRTTGIVVLLTHRLNSATTTGNGTAIGPVINADGTHVAFLSTATNLTSDDLPADGSGRLFVYDIAADTLTWVDRRMSDPSFLAPADSGGPHFSKNGRYLVFGSSATDLVTDQDDANNSFDVFLYDTLMQSLRLVSHTSSFFSTSSTGNGGSGAASIDDSGRYIVYSSAASNLVQGQNDANGGDDIFLFDRDAPDNSATRLVSHSSASATVAADGTSDNPAISLDGSTVAFTTQGTNLVAGVSDSNSDSDVYVYDRASTALTLVSHSVAGNLTTSGEFSGNPTLSPDGRYVVHTSSSANVLAGQIDASKTDDLFLFDRTTSALSLLSHKTGAPSTAGAAETKFGFFSRDGAHIVLVSRADNLVAGQNDTNNDNDPLLGDDVYLADPANPGADLRLLSHAAGLPAVAGKRMSYTPAASTDASLVVYVSQSDELPSDAPDANAATDLLAWTSASDASTLITRHASGADDATLMGASQVQVSRDGNWIAFVSRSPHVIANENDTNREDDLYLLERATGNVRLVSHVPGSATQAGNRGVALTTSTNVSISADGRYIAFETNASDLSSGVLDNNLLPDILLFDRDAAPTAELTLVSRRDVGGIGNGASTVPRISANAHIVTFVSTATNLLTGVSAGPAPQLYLFDVQTATLKLASHNAASATTGANGQAQWAAPSDDGHYVAYLDDAPNLVNGQTDGNGVFDVFVYDVVADASLLVTHAVASATTAAGVSGNVNQPPVISAAGDFVAYASEAQDLVSNFQNNIAFGFGANTQVYRWRRDTGANQLLSHAAEGVGNPSGDGRATFPSISGDGARVAFMCAADDLVGADDSFATDDLFLWDQTSDVTLVTHVAGQPLTATGSARGVAQISADGARVVYASTRASVASGATLPDPQQHLFLYNIAADVSVLITPSVLDSHVGAVAYADQPALDATATTIVFQSPSYDLVSYDGNAFNDAFVLRRGSGVPQIAVQGDITLPEDQTAGPLAIAVTDADTPLAQLAFRASSSDTNLLPDENIVIATTAQGISLSAMPTPDASGSALVTLQAIDGDGNAAATTFTIVWQAVNDPPSLSSLSDQTIDEDTLLGPLDVQVGDVESGPDGVVLAAHSSNQAIVPDAAILIGGSSTDRTVTIKPAQDANGVVTITLTAQDPVSGGPSTVAAFQLTISAVNDTPFVIAPANVVIFENSNSGPLYFGVADIETPAQNLLLSIASSNPAVLPAANVVIAGTGMIRTLTATPLADQTGVAAITLTVMDTDGASRSQSFNVKVVSADTIFIDGFEGP